MRLPALRTVIPSLLLLGAPLAAQQPPPLDSLYQAGDTVQLEKAIAAALKVRPSDAGLHITVADVRFRQRHYAQAAEAARAALQLDRSAASRGQANLRLADAAFMLGDTTTARAALREAAALTGVDRLALAAANRLRLIGLDTIYAAWTLVETEHFRVRFPPEARADRLAQWVQLRETALTEMQSFFRVPLPKKIDMIVWTTREQAAANGFPQLGFATPPLAVVHTLGRQTPGHEPAHIVAWLAGGGPSNDRRTQLISDGTSVYFDGTGRRGPATALAAMASAGVTRVSILELWSNPQIGSGPAIIYPVGGFFVQRLIERGGRDRFLALMRDHRLESARAIYGPLLDEIIADVEKELTAG